MTSDARSVGSGTRLGSYQLGALVGSGAMGDVYRAHDTKLGRDVAIKILPERFTLDSNRLARFDREARLLATLNHPHIAAIYGIEEHDGVRGLVLELVEGETLGEWIARRPTLTESLRVARQIADGLDAAHEKGVVHRDLKPANIKITPTGVVKVLDFGLAKAAAGDAADGPRSPSGSDPYPVSQAMTEQSDGTEQGVILGTAPYMSPEQARGKTVDKRTDIWAFGCVLYEILAKRRAFAGDTATDVFAAILDRDPDWSALPPGTPPIVSRLLRRCLDKDPGRRLRDIADARLDLDDVLAGDAAAGPGPHPAKTASPWLWLLAGAALASAAFGAWTIARRSPTAVAAANVRFERITDFVGVEESPAISPDGKAVAFVAPVGGRRQIWVRLLASGSPQQITREDVDHDQPRWTRDSSSLVYFTASPTPGQQGTLWEIPMLGGAPRRIGPSLGGGDVSHDGFRIAAFQFLEGRSKLVAHGTRRGKRPDAGR